MDVTVFPSLRCGCVASLSTCAWPISLPGNAVLSRSTSHWSNSSGIAPVPEDPARRRALGFGRKKGRRRMYAVERLRKGRTRSVPSPAPVEERAVQPCQGRKMEHRLLPKDHHEYRSSTLRALTAQSW